MKISLVEDAFYLVSRYTVLVDDKIVNSFSSLSDAEKVMDQVIKSKGHKYTILKEVEL